MSPDRPLRRRLPDRLVPYALAVDRRLPDEVGEETASVPLARIARYACYALVVLAVGWFCAGVVAEVVDALAVFSVLLLDLSDFHPVVRLFERLSNLLGEAVRAFTLLVALGVFLTQFE